MGGVATTLMAKILAALFAAGATLALLTVALPHPKEASTTGLLVIVGVAFAAAGGLYRWADALPPAVLPPAGDTPLTAGRGAV